jgi:hypothetical protein
MKAIRLHIPGEYEDAFLYMGRLALLTSAGTLQMLPLRALVQRASVSTGARQLLRLFFERNDLLSRSSAVAAAGSEEKHNRLVVRLIDGGISIDEPTVESELALGVNFRVPLDLRIYYRRVYLATDQGLHSMDLDYDSGPVRSTSSASKRTEARCLGIAARHGLIHASCEDAGLWSSIDEFGWLSDNGKPHAFKLSAATSRRVSWLTDGFLNYASPTHPALYTVRTAPVPVDGDHAGDTEAVFAIDRPAAWSDFDRRSTEFRDADFIWSSLNGLFVNSPTRGLIYLRTTRIPDQATPNIAEPSRIQRYVPGVAWAGTYGGGVIVETGGGVLALENHQMLRIDDRPVIALKTFPTAVWYKRVAVVVTETDVTLTAIIRDALVALPDDEV